MWILPVNSNLLWSVDRQTGHLRESVFLFIISSLSLFKYPTKKNKEIDCPHTVSTNLGRPFLQLLKDKIIVIIVFITIKGILIEWLERKFRKGKEENKKVEN